MKGIFARNKYGYIGKNGKLPWRSKEDFKHFKQKTKGGILIVGKRTWEDDLDQKPLPGRHMIVIGEGYNTVFQAVQKAILLQEELNNSKNSETFVDIWVIGGATIYKQLLPLIEEFHISEINNSTAGDVRFDIPPDYRGKLFQYHFECD